jgi:hypothetical protein
MSRVPARRLRWRTAWAGKAKGWTRGLSVLFDHFEPAVPWTVFCFCLRRRILPRRIRFVVQVR